MLEIKNPIVKAVVYNSSGFAEGAPAVFDCVLIPRPSEKHQPPPRYDRPPCINVLKGMRETFRIGGHVSHGVVLGHTFIRLISWPLCKPEGLDYFAGNFAGAIRMYYGGVPVEYLPRSEFSVEADADFLESLRKALVPDPVYRYLVA